MLSCGLFSETLSISHYVVWVILCRRWILDHGVGLVLLVLSGCLTKSMTSADVLFLSHDSKQPLRFPSSFSPNLRGFNL